MYLGNDYSHKLKSCYGTMSIIIMTSHTASNSASKRLRRPSVFGGLDSGLDSQKVVLAISESQEHKEKYSFQIDNSLPSTRG